MNEHTPSTNRNPVRLLAITLAAAGLLVSACGTAGEADGAAPAVADLPAETGGADIDADAGSDSDSERGSVNGEDRPEPTEEDIEAAELEFEQCLADAGIDASGLFGGQGGETVGDDPGSSDAMVGQISADGLDDDEFNAAMEECNKIFEDTFGTFEPSPEDQARLADAEAAFANCMAEAGFDIPESDGSGGIMIEFDETTDMDVFDEASERCSAEAFDDDLFVGDDSDGSE